MAEDRKAVEIKVPKTGGERDPDEEPEVKIPVQKEKEGPEMSEEDQRLQATLTLAVERTQDPDSGVQALAITTLRTEIREATASMTSVPKPLKFLRPHYPTLTTFFETMDDGENKKNLADVLSVLAMTMGGDGERKSLSYKLQGNRTELGSWGHEFVRNLAGEIGQEYQSRIINADVEEGEAKEHADLLEFVDVIVPFHMEHNAEAEAVDLLMELGCLDRLLQAGHIDGRNFQRVGLYLLRSADYADDLEDQERLLRVALGIYRQQGEKSLPDALRVALRLHACADDDDGELITEIIEAAETTPVKRQLAYMRGRAKLFWLELEDEDEDLTELASNTFLTSAYATLARELDTEAAKTPEDIYKSHLADSGPSFRRGQSAADAAASGSGPQSARGNLASTFVNAFVNAGYGRDTLMTPDDSRWVYNNKDHGMISATASLGMVLLWNVDEGLTALDKYMYSTDDNIKAGALLAMGVSGCGVRDECDSAVGLLPEHLEGSGSSSLKACAALGLGLAYCGAAKEEAMEALLPAIGDTSASASMEVVSMAALAAGMVQVGTCDDEACAVIMQRLMEASDAELDQAVATFLIVGLGLLFLGRGDRCDGMLEAVKTVEHKIARSAEVFIQCCAYANTGNVLQVQALMHQCAAHLEESPEQSLAVLGIAMVAMGEDVGEGMVLRALNHLLQYGEAPVRRAVPLAMAMMHVSRPEYYAVDMLTKLSHDPNVDVAIASILGLGIISAGTNNSRVAATLRQLAGFYKSEPNALFMVRIAQGLLHMGKGLLTISPYYSDRLLLSPAAMAGLLPVLVATLDAKNTLLGKFHYVLFTLSAAMWPRMVMTVDEEGENVSTTLRVGKAVDTVGQPGRPKTITGFQTHTTPVLLGVGERAELATDIYFAATSVLESVVVLTPNPDSEDQETKR